MLDELPPIARKGRGAVSNREGRFERWQRTAIDDGWSRDDAPLPRLPTQVLPDASRRIIARNTSPDLPFDRSINPYRGCEHGCVYCFARPTHAWLGLSPGLDFETRILAKPDAPRLLEAELSRPGYRCRPIAMGTNTDPYQPVEAERAITRGILGVLSAFNHPLTILTKSALVLRDLDILADMARRNLVSVSLSVTTLDRGLARLMEPRAATPSRRLETIRGLVEAGIPTGVMTAPVIPGLNDHEIEAILEAARAAGAGRAGWILLRLPLEVRELFEEWLASHFPDRAGRVLSLIRQCRGGRLNDAAWGRRMSGSGPVAGLIERRFRLACRRLGYTDRLETLETAGFRPPSGPGDQLALFA